MTDEIKNGLQESEYEETVENTDEVSEITEETAEVQNEVTQAEKAPRFEIDVTQAENSIPDYVRTAQPVYDFELEDRKKHRRPRKRGAGLIGGVIYLFIVIALAVGAASFVMSVVKDITGLEKTDEEIVVEIPQGATLSDIAAILKKEGLIDNELGLLAFAKLTNAGSTYHPGTFTLNPRMGYEEMLNALTEQKIIRETVKITIIEGRTIDEIAQKLETEQVCTAAEFIAALENTDYSEDYDFLTDLPDNEDRIYKLEGYIFPDTYDFYKASDADEVVRRFLDNFNSRFDEELREEAQNQGMTIDEVITLASIVQKEGASEKTMQMVAGVFRNRLDNPNSYPYLQSNATLSYAIGEPILWMDEEQMKDENAYNSYVHKGLPPGAICNPGLQAIKAVLYPDDNDYFFFVTDSNNEFFFSKTASQHDKQVAAIQKNGVGNGEGVS